jgi:hypothetical protein
MKIAVCISGAAKYIESSLASIENLRTKHKVDVFIHTWSVRDFEIFNNDSGSKNTSPYCASDIIKYYNPLKIVIQDYSSMVNYFKKKMKDYKYNQYYNDSIGPLSMFYSVYNCNYIKNSCHKNHDMNIRMRFDSKIESDINILESLDRSLLHIPEAMDYGGVHDQFAFANTKLMNLYCNTIKDIKKTDRSVYHPEKILKECLDYNKAPVNRFQFHVTINKSPNTVGINNI